MRMGDSARRRLRGATRRAGNRAAAARMVLKAAHDGIDLDISIDPSARVSTGVVLTGTGVGKAKVTIGPGCIVESNVVFRLSPGAVIEIGPEVNLRSGTALNVGGHLELHGENNISWNCIFHCADHVVLGRRSGLSEGVSIIDSTHYRSDESAGDGHGYHNFYARPVLIGREVWLAAQVIVTHGVTIGDKVTVASGSIVSRSMPAGALVNGRPAKVLRKEWSGRPSDA
ncbi:MAG: DapH/DapD/GlmU-related protein [Dermatophilus congolensis]|nr:DapH/DapD/GlmU-related protein [Dermatophilus congolensis]